MVTEGLDHQNELKKNFLLKMAWRVVLWWSSENFGWRIGKFQVEKHFWGVNV